MPVPRAGTGFCGALIVGDYRSDDVGRDCLLFDRITSVALSVLTDGVFCIANLISYFFQSLSFYHLKT